MACILSASWDNTARIWNTVTGECEAELQGHSDDLNSAVFSPNGMHIVSASSDNTARIWNTVTGECEAELKEHTGWVSSAVFSPDSTHIVTASLDGTARIWNIVTGKCEAVLKGHTDCFSSAVFSSDGIYIASVCTNYTVRIWNTVTGECEAELNPSYMSENTQLSAIGVFNQNHNKEICPLLQLSSYEDNIFHTETLQKISIPHPFRMPVCISHHLSKICLGYGSGDIMVLEVCIFKSYSTLLSHFLLFLNLVPGLTL
jgi:WD40 repeat protein